MKNVIETGMLALGLILVGQCAHAYENENAVPLAIGAHLGNAEVEAIQIQLKGRDVEIESRVRNPSKSPMAIGFYAITPLFENLGDGEEHADKRFSDLSAMHNGQTLKTSVSYGGFFLGQEITSILRNAGIDAIPSNDIASHKIAKLPRLRGLVVNRWQGQASHAWVTTIAPQSTGVESVRYRSLPQFGMEEVGSTKLAQLVLQHCGKPEDIRHLFSSADGEQVLIERFELPIQFMKIQDVQIKIEQSAPNWLGATPVTSLACGLDQKTGGKIAGANQSISILVISRLTTPPKK